MQLHCFKKLKSRKGGKKERTVYKNDKVKRVKANSKSHSLATKFWGHTHSKNFKSKLAVFH